MLPIMDIIEHQNVSDSLSLPTLSNPQSTGLTFVIPHTARQPPRLKRQILQMDDLGPDEHGERDHANGHTQNVDNVVSVLDHVASAAIRNTLRLVLLDGAAEGLGECGRLGRGNARGGGEVVD